MELNPPLQLDVVKCPELLNPQWAHWQATLMSIDGKTPAEVDSPRFMAAVRAGAFEIAKKLTGKGPNEFTWELEAVPSDNGLYRVKIHTSKL